MESLHSRHGWAGIAPQRAWYTKFVVFESAKPRRFVVASLCAPVCCVRKDSLSVSDLPCYYCFYLCLLDGALRCGTLWHKNRLTPSLSLSLSPQLGSALSPQSTAQHRAAFPGISAAANDSNETPPRRIVGEIYNCISLCRLTFLFVLLSCGITSITTSDQQCISF